MKKYWKEMFVIVNVLILLAYVLLDIDFFNYGLKDVIGTIDYKIISMNIVIGVFLIIVDRFPGPKSA